MIWPLSRISPPAVITTRHDTSAAEPPHRQPAHRHRAEHAQTGSAITSISLRHLHPPLLPPPSIRPSQISRPSAPVSASTCLARSLARPPSEISQSRPEAEAATCPVAPSGNSRPGTCARPGLALFSFARSERTGLGMCWVRGSTRDIAYVRVQINRRSLLAFEGALSLWSRVCCAVTVLRWCAGLLSDFSVFDSRFRLRLHLLE